MLYAFPLTLIPFILFNIIGFAVGGDPWSSELLLSLRMVGGTWHIHGGDLMLVLGLVMLFLETLKSTRPAQRAISNHLASTGAFILYLLEFVLLGVATNSTFFILMLMSLFDVVGGFTISIRTASRDVTYNRSTDPV